MPDAFGGVPQVRLTNRAGDGLARPVIACIEDHKRLHERRVPKMLWDYMEWGGFTKQAFRENTSDFSQIRQRRRVGRGIF